MHSNVCMCQGIGIRLSAFGDRLREARGALSQADFGRLGGVQRNAQAKYESGERYPDAAYLQALAASGIDVQYLLTGQGGPAAGLTDRVRGFAGAEPSAQEIELLSRFRRLGEKDRRTVLALIDTLTAF